MSDFGHGKLSLLGRTDRANQLGFVSLADGRNNAYIGLYAGASRPQAGINNTFVGTFSGSNSVSESSTFLGTASGRRSTRTKETCFIGYRAGELAERVESSVCVGAYSGRKMTRANCNTLVGYQSGAELTSGSRNTIVGAYAAFSQFNAHDNVCIGHRSGYKNTIGSNNCYIGTNSGFAAYQGYDNVALGVKSGEGLTSGKKNVLVGYAAGGNISGASNCIAIGTQAMEFFFNGDTNTCVGTQAAKRFTGMNNTILGGYSTSNASGNYNTIIGSRSMNRKTGDRVALSNCVIIGENIQFDIPVRIVTAYAKDMDVIPDSQIGNPDPNTMILSTPSRTFIGLNLVPVGDPMLVKERFISLGSFEDRVLFDTSYAGRYTVEWGSEVLENNTMALPIPVRMTFNVPSATQPIQAILEVYDDFVEWWTIENTGTTLDVYLAQEFNPPSIRVVLGDAIDETFSDLSLPGKRIPIQRIPEYDSESNMIVFATSDVDFLVPGMEVQINKSSIEALNTIVRIIDIGSMDTDGIVPLTLNTSVVEGVSGSDLGNSVELLASRSVSRPVYGTIEQGSVSMSEPFFSGMLFGMLTDPMVYVDGTGDVDAGVYPITVLSKDQGIFAFDVDAPDGDVFVGHVAIGTFESLIVGFQISTSSNTVGPSESDGHVQSGVGSQSQMDAEINLGYLLFQGGGFEFATYELGSGTTTVDLSGTFEVPLTDDIDFGIRWMGHYDLKCVKQDSAVAVSITSTNDDIVTNVLQFSTAVFVIGSIETSDFPIDISSILTTSDPQMTVNIVHDTNAETLTLIITFQGGTRFGNRFSPQGAPKKAKLIVTYVPTPETLGSTVQFYANGVTKVSAVALVTNVQNTDDTLLSDFSIRYSQRSDTGLQINSIEGPTAFDGHTHRGEGTLDDLNQDIRSNVLTFSSLGYSAADYSIGALNTEVDVSVTYDWAETEFGIEWLDSYTLTCTASSNALTIELYHVPTNQFLVSFTPEEMYGRVKASFAQYDATGTQLPMSYPPNIVDIQPENVKFVIQHEIKNKRLVFTVTITGETDIIVYTFLVNDTPPVNRFSDILSFVAYGNIIARDISIAQSNYKSFPTFEDCIFVGSNFTVGGDVAIVDKERANVFIAAIGDTRLFRGRTEEFVFFSNVVTANALYLKGGMGDDVTLVISGNDAGNALHVTGDVSFTMNFSVDGITTLKELIVTGPVVFQETLHVTGAVEFQDTLNVTGAAEFQGTMNVTGAVELQDTLTVLGGVELKDTLNVTGAVGFQDTLNVTGAAEFQDTLNVSGAAEFQDTLTVSGAVGFQDTLTVTGAAEFENTLTVTGAAEFENTLTVSGAAEFENTLTVTGSGEFQDTLTVSGDVGFGDSLTVSGDVVFNSQLIMKDDIFLTSINDVVLQRVGFENISVRDMWDDINSVQKELDDFQKDVDASLEDIDASLEDIDASLANIDTSLANLETTFDTAINERLPISAGSSNPLTGSLFTNFSVYATNKVVAGSTTYSGGATLYCQGTCVVTNNLNVDNNVTGKNVNVSDSVYAASKVVAGATAYFGGASLYCQGTCVITNNLNVTNNVNASSLNVSGTKNFDVPHPVLDAPARLVHACIESPRCDLMYRGMTRLVHGRATVIIDVECTRDPSGMTRGTFHALTTNPVAFVQCTDSFDRVIGSVDSGVLEILCDNPDSNGRVQWMVVAERNDTYMTHNFPEGIFKPEQ